VLILIDDGIQHATFAVYVKPARARKLYIFTTSGSWCTSKERRVKVLVLVGSRSSGSGANATQVPIANIKRTIKGTHDIGAGLSPSCRESLDLLLLNRVLKI